jgi:hypothetical protein
VAGTAADIRSALVTAAKIGHGSGRASRVVGILPRMTIVRKEGGVCARRSFRERLRKGDVSSVGALQRRCRVSRTNRSRIPSASSWIFSADSPPAIRRGQAVVDRGLGYAESRFLEKRDSYFFFAAAFATGLAGALAFAFFLSLPCELLPLAIVKSFH